LGKPFSQSLIIFALSAGKSDPQKFATNFLNVSIFAESSDKATDKTHIKTKSIDLNIIAFEDLFFLSKKFEFSNEKMK